MAAVGGRGGADDAKEGFMGQGMAALKIVANSIGPTVSVAAVIVLLLSST
jgi:hypothetical protein